ncbi:hypothetical protein V3589_20650 [Sinorhizobium fredii]|uniref:hypothetical protein n=1 Tax=Rhizobium fredii TaxID=380 RepID=UPI0030A2CE66
MSDAWIGIIGVAVGGILQIGANWLMHYLAERKQAGTDASRKKLLKKALSNPSHTGWMRIETLAHLVGASLEHTRGLLIAMNARGSLNTDKEMWALISRQPLPETDE